MLGENRYPTELEGALDFLIIFVLRIVNRAGRRFSAESRDAVAGKRKYGSRIRHDTEGATEAYEKLGR